MLAYFPREILLKHRGKTNHISETRKRQTGYEEEDKTKKIPGNQLGGARRGTLWKGARCGCHGDTILSIYSYLLIDFSGFDCVCVCLFARE